LLIGGAGSRQFGQPIGGDGLIMAAVGGAHTEPALTATPKTLLAHQSGDAVATMHVAGLPQRLLHPRTAVSLAAGLMNANNLLLEAGISQGAWREHQS